MVISFAIKAPIALPFFTVYLLNVLAMYPFVLGGKSNLTILHSTLPARRQSVVTGRYAYAMASLGMFRLKWFTARGLVWT